MPVVARAALAPLAAAALPAVALRQATTWIGAQPYVPLTSGTASGTGWLLQQSIGDSGTRSVASGTAIIEAGPAAGCIYDSNIWSPALVVSAFGSVWAVCTDIQPINSATGTTSRPDAKSLSGLTASVGVQVGSYVWLAGQGKLNGHGKMKAVAVGVDATGTVRKRFTTRTARRREAAVSIAHGAGEVRAGDGLGRVYGLSPSTAKLRMTIRAGSPQGLAGRTSITVMSRPRAVIATGGSVWVFTDKYLYRYNPRSLGQTARHAAPSGTWIAAAVGPGGVARWPSSTRAGAAEVMRVSCPRGSCGAPRAPSRHPARAAAARR